MEKSAFIGFLLLSALVLTSCSEPTKQSQADVIINSKLPQKEKQITKKAVDAFFAACPQLREYWSDVKSAQADIHQPSAFYRSEQYGWRKEIKLKVVLKNDTKKIPNEYRAWGHTLYYFMGGGKQPGYVATKPQAQQVCGLQPSDSDTFRSVAALAFLGP